MSEYYEIDFSNGEMMANTNPNLQKEALFSSAVTERDVTVIIDDCKDHSSIIHLKNIVRQIQRIWHDLKIIVIASKIIDGVDVQEQVNVILMKVF